ncbi:MAG: helix-turn-helix domain-containing protein [Selenomonadaceae bacterium]|nr:helix-turn-helix domain-containing protein [Selenomonadaceae bacterium]
MKTKNAFAFRDFDSARILQRPFFKDFYFASDKSDAEILESLNKATEDSADSWERRLYSIKATLERLTEFRHLIDRHNENRLNKYNREKSESKGIKIVELQRPAPVMEYFNASLSVSELMNKFEKLYSNIEKKVRARYRKEFGKRLKQTRQQLGLTQRQLSKFIRVSPQIFSLYERGEQDVPAYAVIRLAKALNTSSDQLLGLK